MRQVARVFATLGVIPIALCLIIVSLPWVLWAIGRGFVGDHDGFDNTMESAPIAKWLDWVDRV